MTDAEFSYRMVNEEIRVKRIISMLSPTSQTWRVIPVTVISVVGRRVESLHVEMFGEISVDVAGVEIVQTRSVVVRERIAERHVEKEVGLTGSLDDEAQLQK